MNSNLERRSELCPSKIHGTGCFTRQIFQEGDFICHYEGERITPREALRRAKRNGGKRICHVNSGLAIDGSSGNNGTHCVNHTCQPNCHLVFTKNEILIYAAKKHSQRGRIDG